jgi:hypothetical protein
MSERKATAERDDRLSIPMRFEDAVRSILKVKPETIRKPPKPPRATKVAKKPS